MLLVFGRLDRVPVAGVAGLIMDAVPQGFAIALMATLVPTLLTRRRLALNRVEPVAGGGHCRPMHPFVRALAMATMGAGLTVALTALLLVVGLDHVDLPVVLAAKTIWSLLLGGGIAAVMTRAALEQR